MSIIKFLLSGDSKELDDAAKKGKSSLIGLKKEYRENVAAAAKFTTATGLAGIAIATHLVNNAREAIDTQAKLAHTLDTTSESIAVMTRAGELSGVALDKIGQASKDLQRRLSQAAAGEGAAADALKQLHLQAEEILALPLDRRIDLISRRLREFVPQAQQAAVAGKLFGEEGSLAMMQIDPDTIARASEETRVFGLALSEVDAAQVENANDSFSRLQMASEGIVQQATIQLAPVLEAIGDRFFDVAKEAGGVGPAVEQSVDIAVRRMIELAGTVRPVIMRIREELGSIWEAYRGLPPWAQEIGIVGAIIGGKKGVALLGLVSKAAEDTKVTAQWFAALTNGDISFMEWLTGDDAAAQRLKDAGLLITDAEELAKRSSQGTGSILGSLFGSEENDQWTNDMLANWERIKSESRQAAEEVVRNRQAMGGIEVPEVGALNPKELEKLKELAKAAFNSTRTEVERAQAALDSFKATMDKLGTDSLTQLGINADDVLKRLQKNLDEAKKKASETSNDFAVFAEQAGRNMVDALADAIGGVESNFGETLKRMADQLAAQQILRSFFGWASGSGNSVISGLAQSFGKSLLPSLEGGGWTGSGARTGGVDGKGGFLAINHPDETMIDHRAGKMGTAPMGGAVTIGNVSFSFPGVTSRQEAAEAGGAAAQQLQALLSQSRRYA